MRTQFTETELHLSVGTINQVPSLLAGGRTILLISRDDPLHYSLRLAANAKGCLVVRAMGKGGTVPILYATRPVAVLLDLDLPDAAAWKTADLLFKEPRCPPVILLTGRTERFDMRTALRAGLLVSKSESPSRLLAIVEEALEVAEVHRGKRNTIQRVLVRWLRPSHWQQPISTSSLRTDIGWWTRLHKEPSPTFGVNSIVEVPGD